MMRYFRMHFKRWSSKPYCSIFMKISSSEWWCISNASRVHLRWKPHPCFQDEFISSLFKYMKFYLSFEDSIHVYNGFQSYLLPSSLLQLLPNTCGTPIVSSIMTKWSLKEKTLPFLVFWPTGGSWFETTAPILFAFWWHILLPGISEAGKQQSNHMSDMVPSCTVDV